MGSMVVSFTWGSCYGAPAGQPAQSVLQTEYHQSRGQSLDVAQRVCGAARALAWSQVAHPMVPATLCRYLYPGMACAHRDRVCGLCAVGGRPWVPKGLGLERSLGGDRQYIVPAACTLGLSPSAAVCAVLHSMTGGFISSPPYRRCRADKEPEEE
jgi:hypothetical protein